jgi:DNA-binding XRE family transcriptional regulator
MSRDMRRVSRAVIARRGELDMTQAELAAAASVDTKTIGSLETRGRWPIARSRARIERALSWPAGEMERIASGDDDEPVVPRDVLDAIKREVAPEDRQRVIDAVERTLRSEPQPPPIAPAAADRSGRRQAG